jgi:hypothetical protein
MSDAEGPVRPAQTWAASARGRRTARSVSEQEVLDVVVELSEQFRAPSTSVITWRLAGGGAVNSAFQSAIRDALEHLHARGELTSVTHRGTHRWSVTRDGRPPGESARAR